MEGPQSRPCSTVGTRAEQTSSPRRAWALETSCSASTPVAQSTTWPTFEELRCFRTSVERVISLFHRNFGLGHCDWRGFEGFESYVWTSVLSGNLVVLARLRLTRKRVHE